MADSVSNITVTNNFIGSGTYSVDLPLFGTVSLPSLYDTCAYFRGSSIIEGNTFSFTSANTDMVKTSNGNCIIRNNTFTRGEINISSYINHTSGSASGGIHQITNNVFDQFSVDGYANHTKLVKGISSGSTYNRNKNQTGKAYITLFDNSIASDQSFLGIIPYIVFEGNPIHMDSGSNTENDIQMIRVTPKRNMVTLLRSPLAFGSTNSNTLNFRRSFNLDHYLEKGMKLNGMTIGCKLNQGTKSSFDSGDPDYFAINFNVHDPSANMVADAYFTQDAFFSIDYKYEIPSSTEFTALLTETQYTGLAGGGLGGGDGDYFGFNRPDISTIGNGYSFEVDFNAAIAFDNNTPYELAFTPIEITYRW